MTPEQTARTITDEIPHFFRCFGGGKAVIGNPISYMLKDEPPSFAAGVEVATVVDFIIRRTSELNTNGKPKKIRNFVKLDGDSRESKILAVLDKSLRHRIGPTQARSTAMLDRDLRDHGYTVMSISTRLSRLRATWRAMGVGELRRIDEYVGSKRVSAYWLEKNEQR